MKLSSPNGIALKWTANILLLLIGVVFVLPLVWVVLASFDGSATLSVAWPKQWTLENFQKVLTPELAFVPLWNSLLLSAGCAILTVIIAVLAAYPLSRYRNRFNRPFLYAILFGTCLPITAMMVPVYSLCSPWRSG